MRHIQTKQIHKFDYLAGAVTDKENMYREANLNSGRGLPETKQSIGNVVRNKGNNAFKLVFYLVFKHNTRA